LTTQPLTAADQEVLRRTAELHRRLNRAAAVARNNALGYVLFGVLSVLFALFGPDVAGLAIGAVLSAVGVGQLRAAARLQRADPGAPRVLARNELVLMGGILVYCLLQLTLLRASGDELKKQVGGDDGLGVDVGELFDFFNTAVYCTFAVVTLLYQGGLALFFSRRGPMVERYLAEAPAWARTTVESLGT